MQLLPILWQMVRPRVKRRAAAVCKGADADLPGQKGAMVYSLELPYVKPVTIQPFNVRRSKSTGGRIKQFCRPRHITEKSFLQQINFDRIEILSLAEMLLDILRNANTIWLPAAEASRHCFSEVC